MIDCVTVPGYEEMRMRIEKNVDILVGNYCLTLIPPGRSWVISGP